MLIIGVDYHPCFQHIAFLDRPDLHAKGRRPRLAPRPSGCLGVGILGIRILRVTDTTNQYSMNVCHRHGDGNNAASTGLVDLPDFLVQQK